MKPFVVLILMVCCTGIVSAQTNTGIGTLVPTNKLHVVSAADPVRIEGLQAAGATASNTLVVDATGVLKVRNATPISAVSVKGTLTQATDNTASYTDVSFAPNVLLDNLGEYSGHTFTAAQTGLYQVDYIVMFNERVNTNDGGDGFLLGARILAGSGPTPPQYGSINYGKINLVDNGFGVATNTVLLSDMVKLSAGQLIQFQFYVYGSTGGNFLGYYQVNISRVD